MDVHLVLPWPPSVNAYYRHLSKGPLAGRTLISKDGRVYRDTVTEIIKRRKLKTMESRLMVTIEANPPDRRRRDLDNLLKALLDALVHSGAIADDWVKVKREYYTPYGKVKVKEYVSPYGYAPYYSSP